MMLAGRSLELLDEQAELILFFSVLALFINWVAWARGFFVLSDVKKYPLLNISFKQVASVFVIYVAISMFIAPLVGKEIFKHLQQSASLNSPIAMMGWLQLFTVSLSACFLYLFCSFQPRVSMLRMWKDKTRPNSQSIGFDFGLGILTWFISFPVVVAVAQLCDTLIYILFGIENYEQVAVRYLKMSLGIPSMLAVALFAILMAAPVIEELLFRGFLQTWLKKHLGTKSAILLSAFLFALFHFAPSQSVGNISLAVSLFAFACFLGFVYERQGSLFASIGLHMTFNAISTFRILFFPE